MLRAASRLARRPAFAYAATLAREPGGSHGGIDVAPNHGFIACDAARGRVRRDDKRRARRHRTWYPRDGQDTCKVVTNATPRVDTPPPPWQVSILRPFGLVGQDLRVYTLPPILDCRPGSEHGKSGFACAPTFLPWAKKNCSGLRVIE